MGLAVHSLVVDTILWQFILVQLHDSPFESRVGLTRLTSCQGRQHLGSFATENEVLVKEGKERGFFVVQTQTLGENRLWQKEKDWFWEE